jgi:hypothetical protein
MNTRMAITMVDVERMRNGNHAKSVQEPMPRWLRLMSGANRNDYASKREAVTKSVAAEIIGRTGYPLYDD